MNKKSPIVHRTRKFGFVFVMFLFLSVFLLSDVKAQTKTDAIPTVTLCRINKAPDEYNGKTVRISATYFSTFEYAGMFDESCGSTDNGAEFAAACQVVGEKANENSDRANCQAFLKPIFEKLNGNPFDGSFANVVVVGTVENRNLSAKLNMHNVLIRVLAIESVSEIKEKE